MAVLDLQLISLDWGIILDLMNLQLIPMVVVYLQLISMDWVVLLDLMNLILMELDCLLDDDQLVMN